MSTHTDHLRTALEQIRDLKPEPYGGFPADWSEQVAKCPECIAYKSHPIQQGICNEHRRPIWARESHDNREEVAMGYRAQRIARLALEQAAITKATQESST